MGRVAIAHPDWPKNLKNPNYNPKPPPYSTLDLKKAALNENFISYMRNWEGFVK